MSRQSTTEKKLKERQRRRTIFKSKRANAMASLAAKVAALGDDALLDEFEYAAFVGRSVQWARLKRINHGGHPTLKIGTAVRYRFGDIKTASAK